MAHFKPQAAPVMAAPNIIPMADIMLVLLIIFMVVTPMLQKGMSVEMAKVISRDGVIFLGNQKTALDQIASLVRDRISNRTDKTVFIKSDGRAKYGDVVKLVDEVRSAGVDNVGLLTDKAEQGRTPPPPPVRPGA